MQKKRNRKRYRKYQLMRLAVMGLFAVILYCGIWMLRYISQHGRGSSASASGQEGFWGAIMSGGNDTISGTAGSGNRSFDEAGDWRLILVNKTHEIPEDYEVELTLLSNGIRVDSRIYPDLQMMFDDARYQGVYPIVGEGYRTHEEQQRMMQDRIDSYLAEGYSKREAKRLAEEWVAKPGTSEHELGIALDINADQKHSSTNDEVYAWLASHAHEYGFILRYPQGKETITGIDYEPWHYRYVGKEAAEEMYESGLTLEEYLGEK